MPSGFTIVRNAEKLDYPFRESVHSLLPLCRDIVINCGDSTDGTRAICQQLIDENPGRIRVFDTIWEKRDQRGGLQLKVQSDAALARCESDWCVYLQADEAIHEDDIPLIQQAMRTADSRPDIDGILFDYVHFYGSYDYQITGRNWYRREVRAFKNHRDIRAFRDAQGFRRNGEKLRVILSGARVFHYGYVRTPKSMQTKSQEMGHWWGSSGAPEPSPLKRHVGLRRFKDSHPAAMRERIRKGALPFRPEDCPRVWDKNEIKNALTFLWESVVPYRIGEFTNYEIC